MDGVSQLTTWATSTSLDSNEHESVPPIALLVRTSFLLLMAFLLMATLAKIKMLMEMMSKTLMQHLILDKA